MVVVVVGGGGVKRAIQLFGIKFNLWGCFFIIILIFSDKSNTVFTGMHNHMYLEKCVFI